MLIIPHAWCEGVSLLLHTIFISCCASFKRSLCLLSDWEQIACCNPHDTFPFFARWEVYVDLFFPQASSRRQLQQGEKYNINKILECRRLQLCSSCAYSLQKDQRHHAYTGDSCTLQSAYLQCSVSWSGWVWISLHIWPTGSLWDNKYHLSVRKSSHKSLWLTLISFILISLSQAGMNQCSQNTAQTYH